MNRPTPEFRPSLLAILLLVAHPGQSLSVNQIDDPDAMRIRMALGAIIPPGFSRGGPMTSIHATAGVCQGRGDFPKRPPLTA